MKILYAAYHVRPIVLMINLAKNILMDVEQ